MTITIAITWATLGTLAAAVVCAVAVLPGTWAAAQGLIYASPVTWTAWAALGVVALVSQIEIGGKPQIVLCTVLGFSAISMAAVAIIRAVVSPEKGNAADKIDGVSAGLTTGQAPAHNRVPWQPYVDAICAGGSAAAFCAMLVSTAEITIVLTIVTDAIAAIPTLTVAWCAPRDQPAGMFYGVAMSSGLAVLAGGTPPRLIEVAYPLYIFGLGATVCAVIVYRRWWLDRPRLVPPSSPSPPRDVAYEAYLRATSAPFAYPSDHRLRREGSVYDPRDYYSPRLRPISGRTTGAGRPAARHQPRDHALVPVPPIAVAGTRHVGRGGRAHHGRPLT